MSPKQNHILGLLVHDLAGAGAVFSSAQQLPNMGVTLDQASSEKSAIAFLGNASGSILIYQWNNKTWPWFDGQDRREDAHAPAVLLAEYQKQGGTWLPLLQEHPQGGGPWNGAGAFSYLVAEDSIWNHQVLGAALRLAKTTYRNHELEQMLKEAKKRCEGLIEFSVSPIAYLHDGMHLKANKAYMDLFGCEDFEELEATPVLDMMAGSSVAIFKDWLKKTAKGQISQEKLTVEARDFAGNVFPATMTFMPASLDGERCVQVVFERQQQEQASQAILAELDYLKTRDEETGFWKRDAGLKRATEFFSSGEAFYLWTLIFPGYQQYLDALGTAQEGELAKTMAERIRATLGELADSVTRLAPHVFCGWGRMTSIDQGQHFLDEVLEKITLTPIHVQGRSIVLHAHLGAVISMQSLGLRPEEAVDRAWSEANRFATQRANANALSFYDPGFQDRAAAEDRQRKIDEVRKAMENADFTLFYQPTTPISETVMQTGEVYTVRIRWNRPDDEGKMRAQLPDTFLPFIKEAGFIKDLDNWTIQRSIAVLAHHRKLGKDLRLIVKVDAQTLDDPQKTSSYIIEKLKIAEVPGKALLIECAEQDVRSRMMAAQELMNLLRPAGVRFILGRVNAHAQIRASIQSIMPDWVRLDPGLVREMGRSTEAQQNAEALHLLCQTLDIKLVADGVEDAKTMSIAYAKGFDFVEGYFIAEPSPQIQHDFSM